MPRIFRIIDFCIQFVLIAICLFFLLFKPSDIYFALISAFFIGVWQVCSAFINTLTLWYIGSFIRQIRWYWLFVFSSFASLAIPYPNVFIQADISITILLTLSGMTALFYLFVMYKLIGPRTEFNTLI